MKLSNQIGGFSRRIHTLYTISGQSFCELTCFPNSYYSFSVFIVKSAITARYSLYEAPSKALAIYIGQSAISMHQVIQSLAFIVVPKQIFKYQCLTPSTKFQYGIFSYVFLTFLFTNLFKRDPEVWLVVTPFLEFNKSSTISVSIFVPDLFSGKILTSMFLLLIDSYLDLLLDGIFSLSVLVLSILGCGDISNLCIFLELELTTDPSKFSAGILGLFLSVSLPANTILLLLTSDQLFLFSVILEQSTFSLFTSPRSMMTLLSGLRLGMLFGKLIYISTDYQLLINQMTIVAYFQVVVRRRFPRLYQRWYNHDAFFEENYVEVLRLYRYFMKKIPTMYTRQLQITQKLEELRFIFRRSKLLENVHQVKMRVDFAKDIQQKLQKGLWKKLPGYDLNFYNKTLYIDRAGIKD